MNQFESGGAKISSTGARDCNGHYDRGEATWWIAARTPIWRRSTDTRRFRNDRYGVGAGGLGAESHSFQETDQRTWNW